MQLAVTSRAKYYKNIFFYLISSLIVMETFE